jgi:hypothetical protein
MVRSLDKNGQNSHIKHARTKVSKGLSGQSVVVLDTPTGLYVKRTTVCCVELEARHFNGDIVHQIKMGGMGRDAKTKQKAIGKWV